MFKSSRSPSVGPSRAISPALDVIVEERMAGYEQQIDENDDISVDLEANAAAAVFSEKDWLKSKIDEL